MLEPNRAKRLVATNDLCLDDTAGDVAHIKGEAATWAGRPTLEILNEISKRVGSLRLDDPAYYESPHRGARKSSDLLEGNALTWGCSAQAQVACHLARA